MEEENKRENKYVGQGHPVHTYVLVHKETSRKGIMRIRIAFQA